ncbi:GHMP kinase [Xanthobacter sp. YC-JY1]|uniref:GHMP family kinase ATP-binding protein n=1 Tax=Xanthobacter sp. YC-JY1 TaxID=2419844 RepID=UPI001F37542A|nr:GHMP kinase [Xanthobacter sp. YC-JY1]UJX46447.1 dehydrogenase [Xanthobacter sp. YC-JY1]
MAIGDALNVRARAPLRLGLAGGGTDLSPYCDEHGGNVLNATIDRFAYAHIRVNRIGALVLRARDVGTEEVLEPSLDHPITEGLMLHRAVYTHMMKTYCDGVALPLTMSTTIDVPAGSGLGASSALVVALIEAFTYALGLPLGPYDVAKLAFDIERKQLGLAGGRQDQYSAAFGGLNFIEFLPSDRVIVNPLRIRREHLNEFEASLVICFSGQSRRSDTIIKEQVAGLKQMDAKTIENMHKLKQDAIDMKLALLRGDIRATADILGRSWTSKKATAAGIATEQVDKLYDIAIASGAWAGKVSGAGGGGFLMFLTDPENRYQLIGALNEAGGLASAVKFSMDGAEGWPIGI